MFTWDEIINSYEILRNGSEDLKRSRLANCMLKMLPSLRQSVEKRLPNVHLSLVMLAVELRIPGASQTVVVQSIDECRFVLRVKNIQYEVLKETEADLADVVEQTMQYLEMTKQEN